MIKKIFFIFSIFFASIGAFAQNSLSQDSIFVVVGYRAFFEAQDPAGLSPDTEKQKEAVSKIETEIRKRLQEVQSFLMKWQSENGFVLGPLSPEGKVMAHVIFKTPTQMHFSISPAVFSGSKEKVSAAIEQLSNKEVAGGHFKIEEIKNSTYILETAFGFYQKDEEDHFHPYEVLTIKKMAPFTSLILGMKDKEKKNNDIISLFKQSQEFQHPANANRHLVKSICVYFGMVDSTWLTQEFIPYDMIEATLPAPDGKFQVMIGVTEEVNEFK